jgi:tRNA (guanosine-2'-O-)-methyltransferase
MTFRAGGGGPGYEAAGKKPLPEELILEDRKERIDEVIAHRTRSLVVVLDRLEDTFNMAAVLRTCEGMGVQEVHVIENPEVPFHPNAKVTQGCDKWLDVRVYKSFAEVKAALAPRGFSIQASAVREGATSLYALRFEEPTALVFGNERFGVSDDVLSGADGAFWIPMRGFTRSLNISAAASACVTRAISWRAEHGQPQGDLSEADREALKARFYELSVKQRARIYGGSGR